jgi:glycosyltransferase involved in cell wall biosynthesis
VQIWGVSMVRNEEDVIEPVIRHLFAEGVDHVLVADNLSTDRTRQILDRLAETLPVTVVDDPDPAYMQSVKVTELARRAVAGGADWIVPFDADELWVSAEGTLRDFLASQDHADVVIGGWYQHQPTLFPHGDPFAAMVWREKKAGPNPKVAFRAAVDIVVEMGAHDVSSRRALRRVHAETSLQVHHYRFRTFGQMVRKVRHGKHAIELAGLGEGICWHWRLHGSRSRLRLLVTWLRLSCLRGRRFVRDVRVPSS